MAALSIPVKRNKATPLPRGLLFICCYLTGKVFHVAFSFIPNLLTRLVPRADSFLAIGMLYVFIQAMGMLGGLVVLALSGIVSQFIVWFNYVFAGNTVTWYDLFASTTTCYVFYAVIRCSWFLGVSLWEIGWQSYAEYPTLRDLLAPPEPLEPSSPRPDGQNSPAREVVPSPMSPRRSVSVPGSAKARRIDRQAKMLLYGPIMVLVIVMAMFGLIPLLCDLGIWCLRVDWLQGLADASSRLNRMCRFSLLIGLFQWTQQFQFIFPRWYRAAGVGAAKSWRSTLIMWAGYCILGPVSVARLLQWALFPLFGLNAAGRTSVYNFIVPQLITEGVSAETMDGILILLWMLQLLYASHIVVKEINLSDWQKDAFYDDSMWLENTIQFKCMFLVPMLLLFSRGFASPAMGFTYAQNDLIVLTLVYPALLVLVWWCTYAYISLRHVKLPRFMVAATLTYFVSGTICEIAGIPAGGARLIVWAHLMRQLIKRASIPLLTASNSASSKTSLRQTHGMERSWCVLLMRVSLGLVGLFLGVRLAFGVLASIQENQRLYPQVPFIQMDKASASSVTVDHAIMSSSFARDASLGHGPRNIARYAVCDQEFWGLHVTDYGMMSLAAYFTTVEDQQAAVDAFFPSQGMRVVPAVEGEDQFWVEIQVGENLTVIAVKGTDFWRASDYNEDIRMWTEPVVTSLLSTVFPTVKIWSPGTTAMVLDAEQEILSAMGIPRPDYKLTRVIDYVEASADRLASREVVFTGHSLGGGIALAAAALVNKPVVAFSPPGMYQSISKHLYRYAPDRRQAFQATHNQSVTIIGENDVVSHIFDTHAGLVQTITCSTEHLAMVGCHMLENTVCNLIRHCKGSRSRHGFDSCRFDYDSKIIMASVARMLDVPYVGSTSVDMRTILESSRYYVFALSWRGFYYFGNEEDIACPSLEQFRMSTHSRHTEGSKPARCSSHPRGLLFICCYLTGKVFHVAFSFIPTLLTRLVPRADSFLAIGMLYVFIQAMGMLGGLVVLALSGIVSQFIAWFNYVFTGNEVTWSDLAIATTKCYVFYAIIRCSWFLGLSLWDIGWQSYAEYPNVRDLLAPPVAPTEASPRSSGSNPVFTGVPKQPRSPRRATVPGKEEIRRNRQAKMMLYGTLMVLVVTTAIVTLIPLLCDLGIWCLRVDWLQGLADASSRLNRMCRFSLLIGLFQWTQQFQFIFPRWYRAAGVGAAKSWRSTLIMWAGYCILGPVSVARLLQWALFPLFGLNAAGRTSVYNFIVPQLITEGVSAETMDGILILLWMLQLLYASHIVVKEINLSDWQKDAFYDDSMWLENTIQFKCMFLVPMLLLFSRGFASPAMGFTYAQNDLIVLTLVYPALLVLVWWCTYAYISLRYIKFYRFALSAFFTYVVSGIICRIAQVSASGARLVVWAHLIRQLIKRASIPLITAPRTGRSKRKIHGVERAWCVLVLRVFLGMLCLFLAVRLGLGVLACVQNVKGLYPRVSFIAVNESPDYNQVTVDHAVMSSNFARDDSLSQGPPQYLARYAICDQYFGGLHVTDYGLMTLAAYFTTIEDQQAAIDAFFPGQGMKVIPIDEGDDRFWVEIQVDEKQTVIAIKGTDVLRVSDYNEDIRMWTEPVVTSLLSTVYPTVKIWSPGTTAMVLDAEQEILSAMGIPRADYKITKIIDYVKLSADRLASREVVFTGHSLGGGIALAAGALVNKPVVAFSPPGMYQSISKHLYRYAPDRRQDFQATHNQSVTIVSENDLVSHIFDTHGGLVQTTTCSTERFAMIGCHMLENQMCNMIRHCPGCATRHGFKSCTFEYDSKIVRAGVAEVLGAPSLKRDPSEVLQSVVSHRSYIVPLLLLMALAALLLVSFEWLPLL